MDEEEEHRRVAARWGPPVSDTRRRGGVGVCWAGCVGPRGRFLGRAEGTARQAKRATGLGCVQASYGLWVEPGFGSTLGLGGFGLDRTGSGLVSRSGSCI